MAMGLEDRLGLLGGCDDLKTPGPNINPSKFYDL